MASSSTRGRRKQLLPLEYMLQILNDPSAPVDRRDRMAICAAQYCHPRAANHPKGQKVLAREAAKEADDGWGGDLQGDWSQ